MSLVYINGKFYSKSDAKISVFDRGFLYGDSVFETLRAYNGFVFKIDEHIKRLYQSSKSINLNIKLSKNEIKKAIYETLKANNLKNAYIRLTVSRGESDVGLDVKYLISPNIVIIVKNFNGYKKEFYKKGVKIFTVNIVKNTIGGVSPRIKSGNFLLGILAKINSKKFGAFEGIILNEKGFVTEGTVSNIFIVKDKTIFTPPTSVGILKGITRDTVIELAKNEGINLYEKILTLHDVYNSSECFLTNTSMEIMPVVNVDGRKIGTGFPGDLTKFLIKKFKNYIKEKRNEKF
jgi:branched-chain amino acid aminotransferase